MKLTHSTLLLNSLPFLLIINILTAITLQFLFIFTLISLNFSLQSYPQHFTHIWRSLNSLLKFKLKSRINFNQIFQRTLNFYQFLKHIFYQLLLKFTKIWFLVTSNICFINLYIRSLIMIFDQKIRKVRLKIFIWLLYFWISKINDKYKVWKIFTSHSRIFG